MNWPAVAVPAAIVVLAAVLVFHPSPEAGAGVDEDGVSIVRATVLEIEQRQASFETLTIIHVQIDEVLDAGEVAPSGSIEARASGTPGLGPATFAIGPSVVSDGEGNAVEGWRIQDSRQGCCWESRLDSVPGILMWPVAGLLLGAAWWLTTWRPAWTDLGPAFLGLTLAVLFAGAYYGLPGDWEMSSDGEGNLEASPLVLAFFVACLAAITTLVALRVPRSGIIATTTGVVGLLLFHVVLGVTYSDEVARRLWYLLILPAALLLPIGLARMQAPRWAHWTLFGAGVAWFVGVGIWAMFFEFGAPAVLAAWAYFLVPLGLPILLVAAEAASSALAPRSPGPRRSGTKP